MACAALLVHSLVGASSKNIGDLNAGFGGNAASASWVRGATGHAMAQVLSDTLKTGQSL